MSKLLQILYKTNLSHVPPASHLNIPPVPLKVFFLSFPIKQFSEEIVEGQLKQKLLKHSNNYQLKGAFEDLKVMNKGLKKKAKWYSRLFSNMYLFVSMVEILISLILVIGFVILYIKPHSTVTPSFFLMAYIVG